MKYEEVKHIIQLLQTAYERKALHECMITLCVLARKTGKQLLRVLIKFSIFEEEMAKMLTV